MKPKDHANASSVNAVLSRTILLLSLAGAFLISVALDGGWTGLGLFLRTLLIVSVFVYLAIQNDKKLSSEVYLYLGLAVALSFFQTIRLSETLHVLNSIAIAQLTMLAFLRASSTRMFEVADYILTPWLLPLQATSLLGKLRIGSGQKRNTRLTPERKHILTGIGISVPFLVVFAALFASADAVFSDAITDIFGFFAIDISINAKLVNQLFATAFLFLFASALFAKIYVPHEKEVEEHKETKKTDRSIELNILLGSLNALFFVFIAIQAVYLFGGSDTVLNGELTYAEYGRRGFFELLGVSGLVFLLAYNIYGFVTDQANKRMRILQYALIAQVGVVMISAIRRLGLYVDVFGYTELRFYSMTFILFLAVVFGFLIYSIATKQKQWRVLSRLVLALAFYLVGLNLINPDAVIAGRNLDRFRDTAKVDVTYLTELSQDAIDTKMVFLSELEGEDRTRLALDLCDWVNPDNGWGYDGWRASNFSADQAANTIRDNIDCSEVLLEYREQLSTPQN